MSLLLGGTYSTPYESSFLSLFRFLLCCKAFSCCNRSCDIHLCFGGPISTVNTTLPTCSVTCLHFSLKLMLVVRAWRMLCEHVVKVLRSVRSLFIGKATMASRLANFLLYQYSTCFMLLVSS